MTPSSDHSQYLLAISSLTFRFDDPNRAIFMDPLVDPKVKVEDDSEEDSGEDSEEDCKEESEED